MVTTATAVLGILSLVCLFGYYLALHDIYYDYASPSVLQEQAKIAPESLPDWTACPLEWRVVGIGFWLMLAFHVMFLATFFWQAKRRSNGI
jgi:hypothetical protein